jgi:hypothetical protein
MSNPRATSTTTSDNNTKSVWMIGDSITHMSESQLKQAIPNITIEAQDSKHMKMDGGATTGGESGLSILQRYWAVYNGKLPYDIVIIALGTNDEDASVSAFKKWIDDAVSMINMGYFNATYPKNKKIIFVTVTTNDHVNEAINAQKSKYNLTVADWKSVAIIDPNNKPHPTTGEGISAFVNTVAQAVKDAGGTATVTSTPAGGGGGGAGAAVPLGSLRDAVSTSFTGVLSFGGLFDGAGSQQLKGDKGMMNDVPLMPFIQQLAGASLRQIMSLPNGQFYAFYPDYFGSMGKHAYWEISDVEVINGQIELSDDELTTHVFVVGDTASNPDGQIELHDKLSTGGVLTIFNAFAADFLNGPDSPNYANKPTFNGSRKKAIDFLQKYGPRIMYKEEPLIRAPVYEAFRAYQLFCLQWAKQFKATFELTFMPELYPGGIIEFSGHGLQCYVESVTHKGSYESGFTTVAKLIAPSAAPSDDGSAVNPDRQWVHAGMIRALDSDTVMNFNPTTLPIDKNRGNWKPGKV